MRIVISTSIPKILDKSSYIILLIVHFPLFVILKVLWSLPWSITLVKKTRSEVIPEWKQPWMEASNPDTQARRVSRWGPNERLSSPASVGSVNSFGGSPFRLATHSQQKDRLNNTKGLRITFKWIDEVLNNKDYNSSCY